MKRFLLLLLCFFLMVPVVVKADFHVLPDFYYNTRITVGGYLEIKIPINNDEHFDKIGELTFKYDPNMLSIEKEDIIVSSCGTNLLDEEFQDYIINDTLVVDIKDGSITIKSDKEVGSTPCTGSNSLVVYLNFKTLKAGEAEVILSSNYYSNGGGAIEGLPIRATVSNPDNSNIIDNSEKENDGNNTTGEKDTSNEGIEKEINKKSNNDIILYCSLCLNVLLIVILVIVSLKKKKQTNNVENVVYENNQ